MEAWLFVPQVVVMELDGEKIKTTKTQTHHEQRTADPTAATA